MPGLAELHQALAGVLAGLADARQHTGRARELLEESRRAIAEAQAQAVPWLPPQLGRATEQLDQQDVRLATVSELITGYLARL
jgi:hypothetical protein